MALSKEDDKNLNRNWLKASLSLHYMKQGLEPFADVRSKLFHEKLVNNLEQTEGQGFTTRHCHSCSSQTFTTNKQIYKDKKWSKIKCPNNICHIWLGVILSSHNYKHTPNIHWDNTDPKLWLKEPWEVAKIFQLQGCKKQKSASEADSSAILALIHNCTYIRKCLTNEGLIKEVQDVRNKIMHSSNLSLPEGDMQKYIKKMLELLQDVISSHQITPLEKDAAQDGYNKINELLKTDVDLSLDKQLEVAAFKEQLREIERKHEEFKDSLAECTERTRMLDGMDGDLKYIIEEQERARTEICRQISLLSERLDNTVVHQVDTRLSDLELSIQDLKDQLQEREELSCGISVNCNRCVLSLQSSDEVHATFTVVSDLNKCVGRSGQPESVLRLQKHLCKFYRQQIQLYPLSSAGMVNVEQLYVKPVMRVVNPDGRPNNKFTKVLKEDTYTFEDIFYSDGSLEENLFICGDAGMGKTMFCEHLVNVWCCALAKLEKGEQLTEDERVISNFKMLFYISLRESAAEGSQNDNDNIEQMIRNQLRIGARKFDLADILETQTCLIIMDGFDEWSPQTKRASTRWQSKELPQPPLDFSGTIMTTSRLWKMETLRAELVGRIDKQVNIVGLNSKAIGQLVEKVLNILDERFDKNKFTRQFFDAIFAMDHALRYMIVTPILLTQLVCLWFDNGSLASSLCELYGSMIVRQLEITKKEKELPNLSENMIQSDEYWMPRCFSDHTICKKFAKLLVSLRGLAFKAFLKDCKETALVFDHHQTEIHGMSGPEVMMCLRIGLLSQNKVLRDSTKDHKQVSFMHKTHQEFFAAAYIVDLILNGSDVKDIFGHKQVTLDLVLEMEKVFVFVCGLDGLVGQRLIKFVIQQISKDSRLQAYRRSMEKEREQSFETVLRIQNMILDCCKEADVNGHSIVLLIEDLAINSDWDPDVLSRILHYWNHLDTSHLVSLCFVIPSQSEIPAEITEVDLRRILESPLNTNSLERILIFDWSGCVDVDAIFHAVTRSSGTLKSLALLNIKLSLLGNRLFRMISQLRLEAFGLEGYGHRYGNPITQEQFATLVDALCENPDLKKLRIEETFCDSTGKVQFDLELPDSIKLEELYLDNIFVGKIKLDVTNLVICEIRHLQVKGSSRSLIDSLKDATNLEQLVVRGFNEPSDIEILFKVLPYLTCLKRFVIGDIKFCNTIIGKDICWLTIPEELKHLKMLEVRSFEFTNSALKKFVDSIPMDDTRTKLKNLAVRSSQESEEDAFEYIRRSEDFYVFRDDYKNCADDFRKSFDGKWMCFTKRSVK